MSTVTSWTKEGTIVKLNFSNGKSLIVYDYDFRRTTFTMLTRDYEIIKRDFAILAI